MARGAPKYAEPHFFFAASLALVCTIDKIKRWPISKDKIFQSTGPNAPNQTEMWSKLKYARSISSTTQIYGVLPAAK